jgi:hypothetical protein
LKYVLSGIFFVLLMRPAYAYLDPGTGSIILQGLLAGIAAGAAVAGMYWRHFLSLIGLGKKAPPADADTTDKQP